MWSELYLGRQENPPKHSQEPPSGYSLQQSFQEPCALERESSNSSTRPPQENEKEEQREQRTANLSHTGCNRSEQRH